MYEEKVRKLNINWKSLIIKMVILLVALFVILWFVSFFKKDKKTVESNFNFNLNNMQSAAHEYFTGSNLPSSLKETKKITLGEMFNSKLLVEFKDQNDKACNLTDSYAEAMRISDEDYSIRVKLVCDSESNVLIDTITVPNMIVDVDDNISFNTNLSNMKSVASNYFKGENLPSSIASSVKLTLENMISKNLIAEFNTVCSMTDSYAEATKVNDTDYSLKVRLVCGDKSDYILDTIRVEAPTTNNSNGNNNGSTNNIIAVKPNTNTNNNVIVSKPNNNTSKPNTNTNNKPNNTTNVTCPYGNKSYNYYYPVAYVISGNCAVSKDSYYNSQYANIASDMGAREYQKLVNEMSSLQKSTGVNLSVSTPIFTPAYNTANTGLVGYQIKFVVKAKIYYALTDVYVYFLDQNGNRVVVSDKRNTLYNYGNSNNNNNNNNGSNTNVAVSKITLNTTNVSLNVGDTYNLRASITPSNATNQRVTWSTSNSSVASVSSSGVITARRAGTVTITANASNGVSASVRVNVTASYLSLNRTSTTLNVGDSYTISYNTNLSDRATFSSSNTRVATVNSSGRITATGAGTATITVKVGNESARFTVYVNESKYFKVNETDFAMFKGGTYKLNVDTNCTVRYSSSNTNVATVNAYGVIVAKGVGTTLIKITTNEGYGTTIRLTVNEITFLAPEPKY